MYQHEGILFVLVSILSKKCILQNTVYTVKYQYKYRQMYTKLRFCFHNMYMAICYTDHLHSELPLHFELISYSWQCS